MNAEINWQRLVQAEKSGGLVSVRDETPVVWGKGNAPHCQPLADVEQVWFWSDQHGYYLEDALWAASLNALKEHQPDRLILGGDWLDLHVISRWNETQRKKMEWYEVRDKVQDECDLGKRRLDQIRQVYEGEIRFTSGNHDLDRLVPWLTEPEAIKWMGLEDAGVICHGRTGFYLRPEHLVLHGDYASANPAKKHWQHYGGSGWFGHKHTDSHHIEPYPSGRLDVWTGAPAMVRRDFDYGNNNAKWTQGWLLGTANRYRVEATDVARFADGVLTVRGERYTA